MSQPKDSNPTKRIGLIKAARIFSNIASPPVIFAILGLAIGWHISPNWAGLKWGVGYGLLSSLSPVLFVAWQLHRGAITDLHMNTTRERRIPYIVGVGCSLLSSFLVYLLNGPELILCLTVMNAVQLSLLGLLNESFLISMHAAGISAGMMISGYIWGWQTAVYLIPLFLLIIYVRLFLKRHTPFQLFTGTLLGIAVVFVAHQLNCF